MRTVASNPDPATALVVAAAALIGAGAALQVPYALHPLWVAIHGGH